MKRHFIRISVLCALLAAFLTVPALAETADLLAVGSGMCGTAGSDVIWTLNNAGLLTISGTGEMESDYNSDNYAPWRDSEYSPYIRQIVIDNGVTNIPDSAFYHLRYLESAIIGNGVETVGEDAFGYCALLSEVVFGNKVKTIGKEAFENCTSLKSVSLRDSVERIDEEAFSGCISLSSVEFGGVKTISEYAFSGCGFTSVMIPDSVTTINEGAFSGNAYLKDIALGHGISSVPSGMFSTCFELESLIIPVNVKNIEWSWGISNISAIYYGGTVSQWNAITGEGKESLESYADHIYYNSSGEETPFHSIPFTLSAPTFGVSIPLNITGGTGAQTVNFITAFYDADRRFIGMESAQKTIYPGLQSAFVPVSQWTFTPVLKVFALDEFYKPLTFSAEQDPGTGADLPDKYAAILSESDAKKRDALIDALTMPELREFTKQFAGWLH